MSFRWPTAYILEQAIMPQLKPLGSLLLRFIKTEMVNTNIIYAIISSDLAYILKLICYGELLRSRLRSKTNERVTMKSGRRISYALMLFLVIWSFPSLASDTAKEKRWADQIVDSLIDGTAVWLVAGDAKFLGIYMESASKPAKGAVIVAHGIGVHPDWVDVVYPLRVKLPEHGWATLSLQMPILPNEAKENEYAAVFPDISPRMNAAIAFLKSKGIDKIVIAGHSLGSTMSAYYLANNSSPVKGLVAISPGTNLSVPNLRYFDTLPKLNKLPILNLYGSIDNEDVVATANKRVDIAEESGNKHFTQIMVTGANHFYQGKENELIKEVIDWLGKNIAQ